MVTSLALIFLVGLSAALICKKIKLPRIIGMLVTGIVIGPYVLDFLDPKILGISSELRQIALIIILVKAGLSLNISDLKKVGRPAVLMSFLPALFEIGAFVLFAPALLKINRLEAAITGAVLGAVSPAVVVPRMVQLMEEKRGELCPDVMKELLTDHRGYPDSVCRHCDTTGPIGEQFETSMSMIAVPEDGYILATANPCMNKCYKKYTL